MMTQNTLGPPRWYAVQTLSNQEAKVEKYLNKFRAEVECMGECLSEVLVPTETVSEIKNGEKRQNPISIAHFMGSFIKWLTIRLIYH